MWKNSALGAALLMTIGLASAQSVYKWKDASGRWVFGDRPPAAAAPQALNVKKAVPAVSASSAQTPDNAKAAKLFPVTLYANNCGVGCDLAKALLQERGVAFALKDPSRAENFEAFKKASPEALAPAMTVGEKALSPFNDLAWIAALDEAGYSAPAKKTTVSPAPLSAPVSAPASAPAVVPATNAQTSTASGAASKN